MSILQNSNAISAGGYDINNSLRFRSSASAYLSRTLSSSGNRKVFTLSFWIKRGALGVINGLFSSRGGIGSGVEYFYIKYNADDTITVIGRDAGSVTRCNVTSTAVFRDPSAWSHIVISFNASATTLNVYSNNVVIANSTSIGNVDYGWNNSSLAYHRIGDGALLGETNLDGYITDLYHIDGQALTPSSFGETDTTTGVWKPKAYTGTYGTNGFYLKFSDIATTSGSNAGLGKDFSGNGNYWTTNNISVTSGTTYDAMTDSPTNTSATVANYATFAGTNLGTYANATITEAGLKVSVSAGGTPDGGKAYAPFGMSDGSGKWYFEMTCVDPGSSNQRLCFGIANVTTNPNAIAITNGYYASASGAHGNYNIGTFTTNDVLQVAYDSGTNKLWFGKNGTWYNSGDPAAGTTPLVTVTSGITYVPFSTYASGGGGPGIGAWNFGQRPFSYTPPTGFNRLNTYNLPDSTIKKGNSVMDATLWTGNGTTQTITGLNFKPDFVWIKRRNIAADHVLYDSVRTLGVCLSSNLTSAEPSQTNGMLTSFNSNGYGVAVVSGNNSTNGSTQTYVGWSWQAGQGSTSSNTNGSITSTVSVNTTAGFSIATYTGTGANATVGHGLGVAPAMVIVKRRNSTGNWNVRHVSITAANSLYLNLTNASQSDPTVWNSTVPTSTVFSIGTDTGVNASGGTYVAYCWAEIAGFSKFTSYTGNGSSDGVFIYTGFRPKYVMVKRTDTTGEWNILDSARNTYNIMGQLLWSDASSAEATYNTCDFLSNGIKMRGTASDTNASGGSYIIACFAETPFKNANAR